MKDKEWLAKSLGLKRLIELKDLAKLAIDTDHKIVTVQATELLLLLETLEELEASRNYLLNIINRKEDK